MVQLAHYRLIHQPLLVRWRDEEKEWIEYINGVNFSTKWNTPLDRLDRLERAEKLFQEIGIPYSIYNRGLYLELKDELIAKRNKEQLAIRKKQEDEFFSQFPELKELTL